MTRLPRLAIASLLALVACGNDGEPCCAGACNPGHLCDSNVTGTCVPCGAQNEVCCTGFLCEGDLECLAPAFVCVTCGASGEPCCSGMSCDSPLTCAITVNGLFCQP